MNTSRRCPESATVRCRANKSPAGTRTFRCGTAALGRCRYVRSPLQAACGQDRRRVTPILRARSRARSGRPVGPESRVDDPAPGAPGAARPSWASRRKSHASGKPIVTIEASIIITPPAMPGRPLPSGPTGAGRARRCRRTATPPRRRRVADDRRRDADGDDEAHLARRCRTTPGPGSTSIDGRPHRAHRP